MIRKSAIAGAAVALGLTIMTPSPANAAYLSGGSSCTGTSYTFVLDWASTDTAPRVLDVWNDSAAVIVATHRVTHAEKVATYVSWTATGLPSYPNLTGYWKIGGSYRGFTAQDAC